MEQTLHDVPAIADGGFVLENGRVVVSGKRAGFLTEAFAEHGAFMAAYVLNRKGRFRRCK